MSSAALEQLDAALAFLPRSRYEELPGDHVPFDELNGQPATEQRLRRLILADEGPIFVVGSSGCGKVELDRGDGGRTAVGQVRTDPRPRVCAGRRRHRSICG